VVINTAAGADDVTIVTTGGDGSDANALGGFVLVNAGDDGDTLTLQDSGVGSRSWLNGENGQDDINVWSTGALSETLIDGRANTDTIDLGSPSNSLGGLLGNIFIDGGNHDAGSTTLSILGDSNTLDSGDILNLNDQGDAGAYTYNLGAVTFNRTGTGSVFYGAIETLNLNTAQGAADVNVAGTAAAVNTNISTQAAADDITW
jgi:hypothetical protein